MSRLWCKAYLLLESQLPDKGSGLGVCLGPVTAAGAIRAWVYRWALAVEDNIVCNNVLGIYHLSPSEKANEAVQHRGYHFWSSKRAQAKGIRGPAAQETSRWADIRVGWNRFLITDQCSAHITVSPSTFRLLPIQCHAEFPV